MSKNGNLKVGGQTKKTTEVVERILEACRLGVPLKFCAAAGAISAETLRQWRIDDAGFDMAVEQARGEFVKKRWGDIQKVAEGVEGTARNWLASAWMLERSFPDAFSRPEIQLGVQINNATTNNTIMISAEEAEKLQRRAGALEAETDAALAAFRPAQLPQGDAPGGGPDAPSDGPNGEEAPRVSENIVEIEMETLSPEAKDSSGSSAREVVELPPLERRTATWWRSLSSGSGEREITREAFVYVLEAIAVECFGLGRAAGVRIEVGEEGLKLRDLHEALERTCGPSGWEALSARGER